MQPGLERGGMHFGGRGGGRADYGEGGLGAEVIL